MVAAGLNTMNLYFFSAAAITFVVGLVHSALGEKLVFRRLRAWDELVPTNGGNVLREHHVRILWASWHLVTVFGWCMGAVLLRLSWPALPDASNGFAAQACAVAALAGSACVFIGTQAKHPGWIGLLAIAVCVWLGGAWA
jgi:hypothetical protein